jgi:hypothetical protein
VMILVMWTGIARSRFIGRGRPWMWRAIHSIAYLMWPIALVHGLAAGRPAKAWVIVSYILCILAVLVGLAVRLSVSFNRNKDFSSTAGAGAMKPVGNMVPTSSPALKKPRQRREPEPEPQVLGPVAVVDTFQPAAAPPPPREQRAELVAPAGPPRQRRAGMEDEIEYDEPAARGRRYPGEDTSTRMRRPDLEDTSTRMRRPDFEDSSARMRRPEMDDTSTRMRRVEMDDTSARMRRVEMDDTSTRMRRVEMDDTSARMRRVEADDFEEPVPPRRRRAAGNEPMPMYDDAPRGRRRAEPDYDDVPRQRGGYDDVPPPPRGRGGYDDEPPSRRSARYEPRFGDEIEDAPRTRRDRGADIDGADSGRHSRTGFVDMGEDDDTPTLVDMASRRARRQEQEPAVRGTRRGGRGRGNDDVADDDYWSQLRGEAN